MLSCRHLWGRHWTAHPTAQAAAGAGETGRAPRVLLTVETNTFCVCHTGVCSDKTGQLLLLPGQLPALESLAECLARGWPALLVGGPASGKTSLARAAAALAGAWWAVSADAPQ